ncbi:hypothetical protein TNCV_3467691 [Trichonephila clavipes]|nr:hypothetical protein TNCV_3467691 [Trichonephila clavipes]
MEARFASHMPSDRQRQPLSPIARIWTMNFFETAEITSTLPPTVSFHVHQSGCTITNAGKQHQAPNTLSMGRRNASRSSAQ